MLGAQIGDDLRGLLVTEGVGEGRHLLAAIENLVGHLFDSPVVVLADVDERGSFLGAGEVCSVAVGTTLVAKEDGAGDLCLFVLVAPECMGGKRKACGETEGCSKKGKIPGSCFHGIYFLIRRGWRAPSKG